MYSNLFPIDWEAFHFLRPLFLWLFVPVLALILIGLLVMRQEVRWKKVIAPHLRPFVIQKGNEWIKYWMNFILLLAFSFGILALAGPTWKKKKLPGRTLETPLVIVLDLSQSMMATDLQPTRLERAKFKINDLLESNPRARVALIGFAGTAHTIVPLTRDYEIITSNIENLKPSVMPFPGSDLETALTLADTLMAPTQAPGTVLILSDDFDEGQFSYFEKFTTSSKNKIEILPMNTPTGSEVPNFWGKQALKDKHGNPVYSSLNSAAINRLGSLEGVTVHQLTLDKSDVAAISKKVKANLKFKEKEKEKKDDWRDAGLLLVIPMAVLLLLWFRKGWVIFAVVLFSSCGQIHSFSDLWYTQDYQGQRFSNKKEYAEAAEHFKDPLRKGIAFYKSGDYESAIAAFKDDTSAMGMYNLGLAYFKNGDTLAAQFAFNQSVELDPKFQAAEENSKMLKHLSGGTNDAKLKDAIEAQKEKKQQDKNVQNKSMEDLSGGGQKATKKDMEKKRNEETVATNITKAKELDQVPDDLGSSKQRPNKGNILMRKVDDDPSLFLKRKFKYQVKKEHIKPKSNENNW